MSSLGKGLFMAEAAEATCRRELELEIPAEDVTKAMDRVTKEFARLANVPGFRKGKAPLSLIRGSASPTISKGKCCNRWYRRRSKKR